ncbi:MAG: DNA polymerase I [Oscillospiraceae bacterium]|nr:DNA polymerase I [Oscillospiraceae bacterium]
MKILAIDYNSLMNRSFYAIRTLTTKEGVMTNALFGFVKTYVKLLKTFDPDAVVVAYDMHAPTFRHKMYDAYKGTRSAMSDELRVQMPLGREFVTLAGGEVIGIEGYEADDILGTVAGIADKEGYTCIIATGDRDSFQLVSENVSVNLSTNKGDILYTPDTIREQYGLEPLQLIEVKSLMGDTSDNIPGVKGIGEKTAMSLIQQAGSLQNILDNPDCYTAPPRIKKLIDDHREEALMSRTLGEICKSAPLPRPVEEMSLRAPDSALKAFLTKYELTSVMASFEFAESEAAPVEETPKTGGIPLTVREEPALDEAEKALEKLGRIAFLLEEAFGIPAKLSVLTGENEVSVFVSTAKEAFEQLILPGKLPLITFDAKPVYHLAFRMGQTFPAPMEDLKLAAYLLSSSEKSYSLSEMRENHLPSLQFDGNEAYFDTAALGRLSDVIDSIMKERGMDYLYREIEIPLCEVLASMEHEGFMVDEDGIIAFGETLDRQIVTLKNEITELAGTDFNLNSTRDLADVLFNRLGLPPKKKTKTGYSTDAEVLDSLRGLHPIIEKILEYRQLSKLSSTYVTGLRKCIDSDRRVRSTFNQTETRTGRISSAEPNVQNIPVRTPLGAEMRKFFVAKEGYTLVDADYSQIELRILAHISEDKNMIKGFRDGADIHRMTASQVFGIPFDEVPAQMRSRAKAINFGIVYGISAFSLSQDIHTSVKEAKQYIEDYLRTYSGVDAYMKNSIASAREKGYVETLFHRPRYLPDIASKKPALRGFSERVAMNMPIQGTAADVIKLAMNRVYRRLKEEGLRSKLILQVHDELMVEAALDEAEKVKEIVREEMENAVSFSVKLEADVHIGENWYIAKG